MNPTPQSAASTVSMAFSPDPAFVRTVRLVAAAVARRSGVPDEVLDEVRLAIGEACTRAVVVHRRYQLRDTIGVTMSDGGVFTVRVTDRGPYTSAFNKPGEVTRAIMNDVAVEMGGLPMDEDALTSGVGLTLLQGLVDNLKVEAAGDGVGTEVRMSWPVVVRRAAR